MEERLHHQNRLRGYSHLDFDNLADMDEDERREALKDAGYDPNDFDDDWDDDWDYCV